MNEYYVLTNRDGNYLRNDGYMSGHLFKAQKFQTAKEALELAKKLAGEDSEELCVSIIEQ